MARLIFAGSPAIAVPYLEALAAEHELVAVVTRTDSPFGRRKEMRETPVATAAHGFGTPVIKANSLASVELPDCDLAVVVAYGGMVPERLLATPRLGWINVHFSLLPNLRGAAPVQRGLWNGDSSTGISIFKLVAELDAGPVVHQRAIDFLPNETASEALGRISGETVPDLLGAVESLMAGNAQVLEQAGLATFAPRFDRSEARIDWTLPAVVIDSRIRALTDEPGAYCLHDEQRVGVKRARFSDQPAGEPGELHVSGEHVIVGTGAGAIELLTVTPAGKSTMSAISWARGLRGSVTLS